MEKLAKMEKIISLSKKRENIGKNGVFISKENYFKMQNEVGRLGFLVDEILNYFKNNNSDQKQIKMAKNLKKSVNNLDDIINPQK